MDFLDKINIIDTDLEQITKDLTRIGVHPDVITIFLRLQDQQRTLQNAMNDMMEQLGAIIQALSLLNTMNERHIENFRKLGTKYADENMDLIKPEKFNG